MTLLLKKSLSVFLNKEIIYSLESIYFKNL